MNILEQIEGILITDVASEGNYIPGGTSVVVRVVKDNFKNLSIEVVSYDRMVRLSYYDTSIHELVIQL